MFIYVLRIIKIHFFPEVSQVHFKITYPKESKLKFLEIKTIISYSSFEQNSACVGMGVGMWVCVG